MKESRRTQYTIRVMQDALISLMEEKPFYKITVTDVCKRADINRSTFYVHFKDTLALRTSIENEIFNQLQNTLEQIQLPSSKNLQYDILFTFLKYIQSNSKGVRVLLGLPQTNDFQIQIVRLAYSLIEQYQPDEYYSIYQIAGSLGVIQLWIQQGCIMEPSVLAQKLLKYALK